MTNQIDFYFDLSSPYAFLSAQWIEEVAEKFGRGVNWYPFMLGVAFKETFMKPLFDQPLRGPYGERDFLRSARLQGLDALVPERFPYLALKASRSFYWLQQQGSGQAVPFLKAAFNRYFIDGIAPDTDEEIAKIASVLAIDATSLLEGISEPAIKEKLKQVTQIAIDKGVFGAPFFFVDGEPFWGNDRKQQIEHWLETGGW